MQGLHAGSTEPAFFVPAFRGMRRAPPIPPWPCGIFVALRSRSSVAARNPQPTILPAPLPSLALDCATLELAADGTPRSPQYGDVYHSTHGALAQARHVFLHGNGLPQRWQGRNRFVIVETGFGLGHNFLATWQAWRDDAQACERLHFISVEKHPFRAADLATAHAAAGVPAALSQELVAAWPMLLPGAHRLEFDAGRVVLTLLLGAAEHWLPRCVAQADAIYLDGFAPGKNPDMWSPPVFQALAALAAPSCTLATWSVSASVRRGLSEAGFTVAKTQGFTGKREMLTGHIGRAIAPTPPDRRALVIGAGLAGTAIAERLAARAWQVTLLEEAAAPAQGASGNLAGAFRPLPSPDDKLLARMTRAGFLYGLQELQRLSHAAIAPRWAQCGVLHVARDADQARKQQATVASLHAPADFLQWLDQAQASAQAGQPVAQGAWWFPRGGWINPPSLCAARLAVAAVDSRFNQRVDALRHIDGQWQALNAHGMVLAQAPHLVLANGHDAQRLLGLDWLPLRAARGQVSHLPSTQFAPLATVVCGSGYLTPAIDGAHALGASFVVEDESQELRPAEHAENLAKLDKMLPGAAQGLDATQLGGRVSQRPISPDRLPMVGALPDAAGLWLLSGFGARGLVWGALCAELLASQISDEPWPMERELGLALAPDRYRKA